MISKISQIKEIIEENHVCPICLELYYKPISIGHCKHIFCFSCLNKAAIEKNDHRCPLCRADFKKRDLQMENQLWELCKKKYPETVAKRERKASDVVARLVVGNISEEMESPGNQALFKWTFFIDQAKQGPPLSEILQGVQIRLHPSFNPQYLRIPVTNNEEIFVSRIGWGTFTIYFRLYWKPIFTENFTDLSHKLEFQPVKKSTIEITLRGKK